MLKAPGYSLTKEISDAVGQEGLTLALDRCGPSFSLADLRAFIAQMPDGTEQQTFQAIARIIEKSHKALVSRRSPDHE